MRALRVVSNQDLPGALEALREALDGGPAVYIAKVDRNQQPIKPRGLPTEVADHVLLLIESSGSTGNPKLIMLGASAILGSVQASSDRLGGPGQWLLALPINHISGAQVLLRSIMADTEPVTMDPTKPFTAEAFLEASQRLSHHRRFVSLVPTQLHRIVQAAATNPAYLEALTKFEAVLVGGARVDWALVQQLRFEGVNVVVSYGMTETAGGCVYDGVPLDGVRVRLEDDQIVISGPVLAEGLQPEYITSDIGQLSDGRLQVLGRVDRVINSGGLKVSLDRVEDVVSAIPGVDSCLAVSVPSPEWGERVGLYIQTAGDDIDPTADLVTAIGPEAKPLQIKYGSVPLLMMNGKPDYRNASILFLDYDFDPEHDPSNYFRDYIEEDDEDTQDDDDKV